MDTTDIDELTKSLVDFSWKKRPIQPFRSESDIGDPTDDADLGKDLII